MGDLVGLLDYGWASRHNCMNAGCAAHGQTSEWQQTYWLLWEPGLGLGVTDPGMVSSQYSNLQCWKRWLSKEGGPAANAVVMMSLTWWCNMLLKGYWMTSFRHRDSASALQRNGFRDLVKPRSEALMMIWL